MSRAILSQRLTWTDTAIVRGTSDILIPTPKHLPSAGQAREKAMDTRRAFLKTLSVAGGFLTASQSSIEGNVCTEETSPSEREASMPVRTVVAALEPVAGLEGHFKLPREMLDRRGPKPFRFHVSIDDPYYGICSLRAL